MACFLAPIRDQRMASALHWLVMVAWGPRADGSGKGRPDEMDAASVDVRGKRTAGSIRSRSEQLGVRWGLTLV
jgi:hypothetical protein